MKYYRHFKGGKYKVLAIGQDSETLEKVVIYQALYGEMKVWVRPYEMFFGKTEKDGVEIDRFKEISKEEVMRSEEDAKYLANKHRGGENNQKGGLYEDLKTYRMLTSNWFVVCWISWLISQLEWMTIVMPSTNWVLNSARFSQVKLTE